MFNLSREKFEELQAELSELINYGRQNLSKKLDDAKSFGDLKENAEYHQARDDQGKMEARIQELEDIIKNTTITKKSFHSTASMGATVVIKKDSNTEQTFQIVNEVEADVMNGKLSENAPLAKSMHGKKEGDTFKFTTPKNEEVTFTILKIS